MFPAFALYVVTMNGEGFESLKAVLDNYPAHTSFECSIEQHDSSGLFPGEFEQKLSWKKGGRFELKVTKPADPAAQNQRTPVPDYFCDGKRVLVVESGGKTRTEPIFHENSSPGWEVTGSLVMMWLMDSPNKKMLTSPPDGLKFSFVVQPEKVWRSKKVLPIELTVEQAQSKILVSLYVSPDKKWFLGMEFQDHGKTGWALFKDQAFDKDLPATLGDGPG